MIAVLYCGKFNDGRFCQQIFNRYGKIIVKQINKALQAHQSGASDILCVSCISDCVKGFFKAFDEVGNIEYASFVIACVCVKPAEIGIAVVYRFFKNLVERRRHRYRRCKRRFQCRFIGFQFYIFRRHKGVEHKGRDKILTRSKHLQVWNTLHQCAVFILCRFNHKERNMMIFPQAVKQADRKCRLARSRRPDY